MTPPATGEPGLAAVAARVRLLAPLRNREFRLLWTGMTLSLLGDGVLLVALAWEAYQLVDRPSAMAAVGVALTLPRCCSCSSPAWSATASTVVS